MFSKGEGFVGIAAVLAAGSTFGRERNAVFATGNCPQCARFILAV